MTLAQLLLAQDRFKVILVSADIPKNIVERLGLQHAVESAEGFRPEADVHVIPAKGVILSVPAAPEKPPYFSARTLAISSL
ncbi:MAG: hypothetical protein LJE96_04750 [Deltaproteobacteria bacterium]|nr:hypothetical protein [Deltaproteobacteria bacterium]